MDCTLGRSEKRQFWKFTLELAPVMRLGLKPPHAKYWGSQISGRPAPFALKFPNMAENGVFFVAMSLQKQLSYFYGTLGVWR